MLKDSSKRFRKRAATARATGPRSATHPQPTAALASSQRKDQSIPTSWGPVAGILLASFALVASQFVGYFLAIAIGRAGGMTSYAADNWASNSIAGQFIIVLISEILAVACIVWYVRRRKGTLAEAGLTGFHKMYIAYALIGYLCYFLLYVFLYAIADHYLRQGLNVNGTQNLGFESPTGPLQLALTFISLAILPPIAEETLFRGFMLRGLRRHLPFWGAAFITSIIFASLHLQFGQGTPLLWVAGLDTFILSMVLCYIREKTGSIWAGALIHGIKNALAFAALYVFKQ